MLETLLLGINEVGLKPGEYVLKQSSTPDLSAPWVVPDGVISICVVCVGCGLVGGGGLSYRNNIPVTPGETLTVVFTNSANTSGHEANAGSAVLRRGSTDLCIAYASGWVIYGTAASNLTVVGGRGGKNASPINDGGGDGGTGIQTNRSPTDFIFGGGAGGYLGKGGDATSNSSLDTAGDSGSGSGSGSRSYNRPAGNAARRYGGGVGLHGVGVTGLDATPGQYANGRDGSVSSVMCGAGNRPPNATTWNAGVRIIWGSGYSFPYNAIID